MRSSVCVCLLGEHRSYFYNDYTLLLCQKKLFLKPNWEAASQNLSKLPSFSDLFLCLKKPLFEIAVTNFCLHIVLLQEEGKLVSA